MLILTIATITPRHLAERLEAAGIPATVSWSLGTCAPWPVERGATAIVASPSDDPEHYRTVRDHVRTFVADLCRDLGENCAMLLDVPATFDLVSATPKGATR